MSRDWYIQGVTMVRVTLGDHWTSGALFDFNGEEVEPYSGRPSTYDLGLALGPVRVTPHFYQKNVLTDDFGPNVPAEIMSQLFEARITMDLIHFDPGVLDACTKDSIRDGFAAGSLMGNGLPLYASGNYFIGLYLTKEGLDPFETFTRIGDTAPFRFPSAFLDATPWEWPLGTETSVVRTTWRAIPYQEIQQPPPSPTAPGGEVLSSGYVVFDRLDDFLGDKD